MTSMLSACGDDEQPATSIASTSASTTTSEGPDPDCLIEVAGEPVTIDPGSTDLRCGAIYPGGFGAYLDGLSPRDVAGGKTTRVGVWDCETSPSSNSDTVVRCRAPTEVKGEFVAFELSSR